jgi:hypothetical protein
MGQWQYKVVVHKVLVPAGESTLTLDVERASLLNIYGAEGWELVSVVNQNYRRDTDPTTLYGYSVFSYYFKKPAEGARA